MQKPDPSSIPLSPGVYLYRDGKGQVIYVGKARILRRRVLSYFRPEGLPAKTKAMLAHAQSIEFLTTTTEKEALLLEASLIKKYRPHYNIVLRDDKQYVLFRVNIKHPFPRLEVVRKARRDGARYFGPFTSSLAARETWKLLHRAFPLRRCSDRAMKNRVRPCLYHHMGQCPAPCMGLVTAEDYLEGVRRVCDLLQGKADPLLKELRSRMEAAAEALEFEQAAVLRDQIRAVEKTVERQATVLPGGGDMDVLGLFQAERGLALGLVFVRGGAMTDGRAFYWPGLTFDDAPELLFSFVGQYYEQLTPPPRILLPWLPAAVQETDGEDGGTDGAPDERSLLEQALSERCGWWRRRTRPTTVWWTWPSPMPAKRHGGAKNWRKRPCWSGWHGPCTCRTCPGASNAWTCPIPAAARPAWAWWSMRRGAPAPTSTGPMPCPTAATITARFMTGWPGVWKAARPGPT